MNDRPAVVLSLLDDVDLVSSARTIKTAWPMFCLKHQVRSGLPVHSLRVAVTESPDLRSRVLLADKRIVLRNSAVVIQAQRFACERVEPLRKLATSRVARRDV